MDLVKGKKAILKQPKTVYTTDIIRTVAKKHRYSQRVVAEGLNAALADIQERIANGQTVQVTNFGTFYSGLRGASHTRDFKTGKRIEIPEMLIPRFRAGQALKSSVRRKKK